MCTESNQWTGLVFNFFAVPNYTYFELFFFFLLISSFYTAV